MPSQFGLHWEQFGANSVQCITARACANARVERPTVCNMRKLSRFLWHGKQRGHSSKPSCLGLARLLFSKTLQDTRTGRNTPLTEKNLVRNSSRTWCNTLVRHAVLSMPCFSHPGAKQSPTDCPHSLQPPAAPTHF